MEFRIPDLLAELISKGIWPANGKLAMSQNLRSLVAPERVRLFAAEEKIIYLLPPPFHTIAEEVSRGGAGDFWERFGALEQIVPSKAVVIGDFGIGSDAPIVLNYAKSLSEPPVYRLRWGPNTQTNWVQGAASFEEFATILGLADRVA
jgi:hypothetical protein